MNDGERFREFLSQIRTALETLPSQVVDLEIGVAGGPDSSWILYGAREHQSVDEHASTDRIGNGDVQIRFIRGQPQIVTLIGRVRVEITPRPERRTYRPPPSFR